MGTLARDHNPESSGLADAASVASIADDAGSGIALVQATSGNRPTMGTSGQKINGFKTVHFNGSNNYLVNTSGSISQPVALFFVVRIYDSEAFNYLLGGAKAIFTQTSRWKVSGFSPSGGHVSTGVHVVAVLFDGAVSKLYVDGQEHCRAGSVATALTTFVIGTDDVSPSFFSKLDLARLKIWTGMSSPEFLAESVSLMTTYGVASLASHGSVARVEISGTSGTTGQAYRIVVPIDYNNAVPKPVALFHIGGAQSSISIVATSNLSRVVDAFLARGMIVAASDMHGYDKWGNDTQAADIDDLYDIVAGGNTVAGVISWGDSRGGQSSLYTLKRRNVVIAWVGVEPVCSLPYAYASWQSEVDAAYGITGTTPNTYAEKTAGRDPLLFSTSVFAHKYMRAYASTGDTTVRKVNNTDALAVVASGVAAEWGVYDANGDHGDATMFQYEDTYDYLGRIHTGDEMPAAPTTDFASKVVFTQFEQVTLGGPGTIWYTLNGKAPLCEEQYHVYTKPFIVDKSCTLRAITKVADVPSPEAQVKFIRLD